MSYWLILIVLLSSAEALSYERQCADMLPHVTHISPFRNGEKPTYSYVMGQGKVPGSTYQCFVLLTEQDKWDMYALLSTFNSDAQIELVERKLKQRNQGPMTRNTIEVLKNFNKYKGVDSIQDVVTAVLAQPAPPVEELKREKSE